MRVRERKRHHGNVASARLFGVLVARAVRGLSRSARKGVTRQGKRLEARGCAVCPWVLLPATVTVLMQAVDENPRTPAARWGDAASAQPRRKSGVLRVRGRPSGCTQWHLRRRTPMDRYIGLDVHAASTTFAVVGPSGKRLGTT